jgi:hypothetical protein
MATASTTLSAAQVKTRANPARLPVQNSQNIKFMRIPWTSTALTTGQTLSLCFLPAGVVPRPDLSTVYMNTDITAQTLTVDIGPVADPNGWAAAIDCAAIGTKPCVPSGAGGPEYHITRTILADDTGEQYVEILATFAIGSGALDVGELVTFVLAYEEQG